MIPFSKAYSTGVEIEYISRALDSGKTSGDGEFTRSAQEWLRTQLHAPHVLLTTSCTHALEMSALLLDIQQGDEVIMPSFTFVSTANAFALHGATPVFVDIDPATQNMSTDAVRAAITEQTKAIIPVHYAGVGCRMDELGALAKNTGIPIVEDNAHGLFGTFNNKPLGTFGALATLSFHDTKNITCGEGGALVINDEAYWERAEIIREKGTNRSRFFRGQVDKYTWVALGSSYVMSEVLTAYLLAQLEHSSTIQQRRTEIWSMYHNGLRAWAEINGVRQPHIPLECNHPAHMYYLILPSLSERQRFIEHTKNNGVQTVFHYLPLHNSDIGKRFGYTTGQFPVTEHIADTLVRLPLHLHLTDDDCTRIIETVCSFEVRHDG
ncbi:MAG: dTDP-4-amino-4,6-dideoxygalactose transaminase [Candidatus Kapabacteria bacterium]|nr:dTDP-4-amino-4,6-dideoxygalactose transaminase [Candidatus Kapabacteria bacterium]